MNPMSDHDSTPQDLRPQQPAGDETALVVVDMQNSFFEFPELAAQKEAVLAGVNELLAAARDAGRPVVLVRTEHAPDRSTWTLNMLADDQGFAFPGTEQARLLDGLDLDGVDAVEVVKTRDSAFHGTGLAAELRGRGVDRLLLCGVSTHSCIAETATAAFALDFHAAIATDANASEESALAAAMLDFLRAEMRQPLLGQDEALTLLRTGLVPDRG